MRGLSVVALVALIILIGGAEAAPRRKSQAMPALTPAVVNSASLGGRRIKARGMNPLLIRAQVLLDQLRFSPGAISGTVTPTFALALEAFQKASGLDVNGRLDEASLTKLTALSTDAALVSYVLSEGDLKGPFLDRVPARLEQQAMLGGLWYRDPAELLAEKFHMDPTLLRALNPGRRFATAGEELIVANVGGDARGDDTAVAGKRERREGTDGAQREVRRDETTEANDRPKVMRVEVDKAKKQVRAFAKDGLLVAVYPASIGSAEKPAPSGVTKVQSVARNPTYTYNPAYGFRGVKAKEKFDIKGGPNNPVGSVWIDLSIESYGIHGTPEPGRIGVSGSHGCVRLTNWDAEELGLMVAKGTEVAFLD